MIQFDDPPLTGIKVVDLSLLLPGPLCSMYLGDMGASVIKIENPRAYDGSRAMSKDGKYPGFYHMLNRNKKAITLNLKKKESKDILYKLLEDADILLEGFRPNALSEMGIGYEDLQKQFPRLIYCGIYGYGDSGPYRDFAGHDANYLALAGVLNLTGDKNEPPSLPGFQLADIGGGTLTALSGILALLYRREKTGKGQKIDVSMMESSLQFASLYIGAYLSDGRLPERGNELLSGRLPNYQIYETADNRYVVLGALEERFFRSFLRQAKIDLPCPLEEKYFPEIKSILEEYFSNYSSEELGFLYENKECCLSLIKTFQEVLEDPHLQERGMITKYNHEKYGEIYRVSSPFSFSQSKISFRLEPPEHGEHNAEIYSQLGYSNSDIESLKKQRII